MSVLKILYYPHKHLRYIAKPVMKINQKIKNITIDMIDTMYEKDGIGLAANQVDIQLQIIVVRKMDDAKNDLILINPKIIQKKGQINVTEGCLSIPGYRASIIRSEFIQVQAMDLYGKQKIINASSMLSICIQHEIDHLNGKLFIDYLSELKKNRMQKKIKKIQKNKFFKEN